MSSVAATIQELFESGQSPGQICKLLKSRASRSGVYKALKRFRETGSTLPKVRSTPDRKVRTPKLIKTPGRKSGGILKDQSENWPRLLVLAMEQCRKCSEVT